MTRKDDYSAIHDKLDRLLKSKEKKVHRRESKYVTGMPGEEIQTEFGCCLLRVRRFDPEHVHGSTKLASILKRDMSMADNAGKNPLLKDMDIHRTLFLDTETTGLAGGTGTVAFLVGIGFFDGDTFTVEQFFMRDYPEEAAMLHLLSRKFARYEYIVTFNGTTFDIPLLKTRFIMHRLESNMGELAGFDLLHAARRIWRLREHGCTLAALEENIIGFSRADDIPSHLIPALYFDYLATCDIIPLLGVFEHNLYDVMTMVNLLDAILNIYRGDFSMGMRYGSDYYSAARIFRKSAPEHSLDCYLKALRGPLDAELESKVLMNLSLIHKREERWNSAIKNWELLSTRKGNIAILALVELAKYYEHHRKEIPPALEAIRKALTKLEQNRYLSIAEPKHLEKALTHRLQRLQRKLRQTD
jgi:hypothetical protein